MTLDIAISSTFTSNVKNRFLRAFIIGQIARYSAIFGVRRIFVYYDPDPLFDSHGLGRYIVKLLKYAVTPPWLKKKVFPLPETDRYFGAVPPLNIKSHEGEVSGHSWGYIKALEGKRAIIDTGKEEFPVNLNELKQKGFKQKIRTLVPVNVREKKVADLESCPYIGYYPYYVPEGLGKILQEYKRAKIATTKHGKDFREISLPEGRKILIFGGPNRGLFDMGFSEDDFDVCVNLFPNQNTKTVRTEEAVLAALFWASKFF